NVELTLSLKYPNGTREVPSFPPPRLQHQLLVAQHLIDGYQPQAKSRNSYPKRRREVLTERTSISPKMTLQCNSLRPRKDTGMRLGNGLNSFHHRRSGREG